MAQTYTSLIAWKMAMVVVRDVYAFTPTLPRAEQFGLAQQMRRAAVSIPSNIAEGYGRFTHRESRRFLLTARGSLYELETQIQIAIDLGYGDSAAAKRLIATTKEAGRVLAGLISYVESRLSNADR